MCVLNVVELLSLRKQQQKLKKNYVRWMNSIGLSLWPKQQQQKTHTLPGKSKNTGSTYTFLAFRSIGISLFEITNIHCYTLISSSIRFGRCNFQPNILTWCDACKMSIFWLQLFRLFALIFHAYLQSMLFCFVVIFISLVIVSSFFFVFLFSFTVCH